MLSVILSLVSCCLFLGSFSVDCFHYIASGCMIARLFPGRNSLKEMRLKYWLKNLLKRYLKIFLRLLIVAVILSLVCFNVISGLCRLSQIISLLFGLICNRMVLFMEFMRFNHLIFLERLLWVRQIVFSGKLEDILK